MSSEGRTEVATTAGYDPTEDDRFLFFVVDYLYDLIEDELTGEDKRGLDDTYTTVEQLAYLQGLFRDWEASIGTYPCRGHSGSSGGES